MLRHVKFAASPRPLVGHGLPSGCILSMPPNWDLNNDGDCNIFDLVLVSNHYNETGTPGWIREDVDNNGQIRVIDLVLVSEHYDETWWT